MSDAQNMVGTGRKERAHVFTAISCGDLVPGSIEEIDAKKLAAELGTGVKAVIPITGRHWTMDEIGMQWANRSTSRALGCAGPGT